MPYVNIQGTKYLTTSAKLTSPSLKIQSGSRVYYGALKTSKQGGRTLKATRSGRAYYLVQPSYTYGGRFTFRFGGGYNAWHTGSATTVHGVFGYMSIHMSGFSNGVSGGYDRTHQNWRVLIQASVNGGGWQNLISTSGCLVCGCGAHSASLSIGGSENSTSTVALRARYFSGSGQDDVKHSWAGHSHPSRSASMHSTSTLTFSVKRII